MELVADELKTAAEHSLDALFILRCERDAAGEIVDFRIIAVNAMAERQMDMKAAEMCGGLICEMFPVNRRFGFFEQYRQTVLTGQVLEQEYHLGASEPQPGWFYHRVVPLADGVAIWQRRISERKREQREREILREQLQHAQRMDSLGRLAGGIAHDFNNLLTPILAYANMGLAQLSPDAPLFEELQEIRDAAERASGLIRQILTFSRKQPMQARPVALNAVVSGLARMLRRIVGDAVTVEFALADDLAPTLADPTRIEQILLNLVVNAREAIADSGTVTIHTENLDLTEVDLKVHTGVLPGSYVVLEVSDNGSGMAPEVLRHVFEPFFTTRDQGKGTGLGLSIVYGLVKQHNGHIRCDSTLGRGTRFQMYFPRSDETVEADEPAEDPASESEHRSAVVLLVEDDAAVRKLTHQILVDHGYQVLQAENGTMAVELARAQRTPVDILVTDVVMPRMNGSELFARLQAEWPALRVVFMSGFADAAIGSAPFIAKPFAATTLLRTVREALASGSLTDPDDRPKL